jgi:heme exporter protein D
MSSLMHWFSMSGYARFIWPAYGLVFVVLGVNLLSIQWQLKRLRKRLHAFYRRSS